MRPTSDNILKFEPPISKPDHPLRPVLRPAISQASNDRAAVARAALDTYASASGHPWEHPITAAKDLLIDLLHLLRSEGQSPADEISRLYAVFRSEEINPNGLGPEPSVTILENDDQVGVYVSQTIEAFDHATMKSSEDEATCATYA